MAASTLNAYMEAPRPPRQFVVGVTLELTPYEAAVLRAVIGKFIAGPGSGSRGAMDAICRTLSRHPHPLVGVQSSGAKDGRTIILTGTSPAEVAEVEGW